ncbi:3-hydroxyacyl-CoA dehydrogenase NAD-binding domain-containing protein [Schinkia azotoformans]|uniref:3-hydroxybutyryl-CoA dehydrogenase n=1 Tax=Schinkia azotoformans LMG 9581 TaxID=1131731 RepID=K6CAG5_SCHAZ|nr:3-hydroxyacyl-CoA dehydrogenase NAD-binding domain-containing protein [Schinkia azotoformans]EKN68105.1 3-hydroxybutyryl-CoA dehydrogenase [Schinkia azotoformans LMG 9581]MEC1638086.1 3-hydroxyacyl-CoA dehydrogenase NAD-binding domain-containing protein [Schinkia azotoformans]MEC1721640.1 3-hydroxyacyl-CoA dehydrogenase NAD-binding domain-containing protein [Schinkia azotoformans]MEC1946480.1 3-hydroxyacyl-CoA dehydrogenase NAD-binding domain-containing protein [Schinkia azotoformans]MED435
MKIGVVGSGIMGNGIAQVFATSGYEVVLVDVNKDVLTKAKQIISKNLEKLAQKKTEIQVDEIVNRVAFTTDKNHLKNADLVIEAIIENIEIKLALFKELDELCEQKTILASNTSSLLISEIASATNRRDRVCGLHFFNPVPLMNLVEITGTEETSNKTLEKAEEFVSSINKESIRVNDTPLFVVNRLLVPLICEAISLVDEGTASPEDVDKGMMLGANHPIGPLRLADMIGLDTMLHIQEALYIKTQDSKYRVPELLRKMVAAGELGRKSGKGFYLYS